MNTMRRRLGLHVAPVSRAALREALALLGRGGMAVFAADVPDPDGDQLRLLGRPARLPTGYARLALAAGVDLVLGVSHRLGPGCYQIVGERIQRPDGCPDRRTEARAWAQAALAQLEVLIRRWPDEWLMPEPLWPSEGG
jgi:lauroyl/myristoyl acyltransferase